MNRILKGITSLALLAGSLVSLPLRAAQAVVTGAKATSLKLQNDGTALPGKAPRRPRYGSVQPKRKPLIDPDTLRSMQRAAGITPGMQRKQRRELARTFAKQMSVVAQKDGTTVIPRAQRRRIQKLTASLVGGALR